jgi:heme/copper-type cytochrome/quinol oxidase subunit 1
MGAVFALFSGFFLWIYKMLGISLWNTSSLIFFWLLFWGVNLNFFPMHFLGMAGMPRRIANYPDTFEGWNLIASYGGFISTLAFFFFLFFFFFE